MGKTSIEWTDRSWTVVTGCSKVSPGCAHCYAETLTHRFSAPWGTPRLPWTPANAAANVILHPERLHWPLRVREPQRWFTTSMGDLFHELVPFDFIDRVFAVMAWTPRHTYQVLTKRPERMREYTTWRATEPRGLIEPLDRHEAVENAMCEACCSLVAPGICGFPGDDCGLDGTPGWPLPNVWLGTSVENQHWANVRLPELLATPAAVRFLSCEPLLGPVDLVAPVGRWVMKQATGLDVPVGDRVRSFTGPWPLHWVIAGGESGPGHRPLNLDWARSLRDQCVDAGVAFLFKQVGGRTPKSGGRDLDGREWSEFPAVAQ